MRDDPTLRPGALVPPPIGRHHIARHRLDAALEAAILDASLVLVAAPAGAGKSVAVSGWVARRGEGAWFSLDGEDNDPALFWPAVAAALGLEDHEAGEPRPIARALFARPTTPLVLVLDDYHHITNPAIHTGIDQLLAEAPAQLRLVIATRHDPPLALSRLRAQAALHEVRYHDLRFDTDELGAVLTATAGVSLPAQGLHELIDRTDGWAAAIQLVGASARQRDDPAEVVAAFAADNRYVFDYFRDEVIAQLPDDLATFLRETAILNRLTAPLCEAVTGRPQAQQVLDELERRNLFLLPLDDHRRWFRYHHLFAEWLRLQTGDADAAPQHRAAAAWLLANGFTADAVRHLIAAGEAAEAADVIEAQRIQLVVQGRARTLHDWIRQLPAGELRRRPGLTLAAAWVALNEGRWDEAHRLAESVESTDTLVQVEVMVLEAGWRVASGDAPGAVEITRRALAVVEVDERLTGLLLTHGRALLELGELAEAARAFGEAAALATTHDQGVVRLIAESHLAVIHRRSGRLDESAAAARAALRFAEDAGLAEHPETAVANLTLAEVLLDEGSRDAAVERFARAEDLVTRVRHVPRERQADVVRRRLAASPASTDPEAMIEQLTGRERSVLSLLPSALTPREIAGELYLSLNTIKTHTRGLYRKLGVSTRHEAIEEARRRNLL